MGIRALLGIDTYSRLFERLQNLDIRNDGVFVNFAEQEFGFPERDAKAFWKSARQNIVDLQLFSEIKGKQRLMTRADVEVLATSDEGPSAPTPNREQRTPGANVAPDSEQPASQKPPEVAAAFPTTSSPEFHFNVQIHLPENAGPEQYEAIFASIAKHLLNR